MGSGALFGLQAALLVAPVSGQPGKELRGLRIAWEVRKTSSSSANPSTVRVWNLSESTRNSILTKKSALILRAGYGEADGQLPLLASGVVLRVEHSPQPPDVVTELQLRDGGLGLDDAKFNHVYARGTLVQDIVDDMIAEMPDAGRGPMVASALSQTLPARRVFSGMVRHEFDKLATAFGFEWSIQDGAVQVIDWTGARGPQVTATVLSIASGLVGSPTKTNSGVKVESLMMPSILPGGFIKVESDFASGYFRAVSVEHKGDSYEGEGRTTTEAKSLDKWVGPGAKAKKK